MHKSIFVLYLECGWCLFGILGHVAKIIFEITEISFFCTKKLKLMGWCFLCVCCVLCASAVRVGVCGGSVCLGALRLKKK